MNKEVSKIQPKKTINGAEALIKCLENFGVEYIWGLPGGSAIPIFDALVGSKIKLILTRHEQGATHMADGYARVTGKPGVVLVTSGPGATNTVTGILTAMMDSVPMIVLTGQVISPMLGKDAFQEADIFGITMPVVKHSYLIKNTNDIVSGTVAFYIDMKPVIHNIYQGEERVNSYDLILEGHNFQQGSSVVVDGRQVYNGIDRDKIRFVNCTRIIYERFPYDRSPRSMRIQIINPNGEESPIMTISAP